MALYWSAAPLFSAGGAYFGEVALYWSAAPLFSAGGAYFGKWALYWTAGPIFDGGGAYFGPVLVAWVSGQKEGFTGWLLGGRSPPTTNPFLHLQNFLMFG